jgi:hypothetical protein
MKKLLLIFCIFFLVAVLTAQDIMQSETESLRPALNPTWQADQVNMTKIKSVPTGITSPGVRRLVPQEYTTIQAAIDASTHGDTILVSDGTYVENINFKGKAITVASLFLTDGDTAHITHTVIDGSNPSHPDSGSVVYFISNEDTMSVLCGFSIMGGLGTSSILGSNTYRLGGGIFCSGVAGVKLMNNHIFRNTIEGDQAMGGGLYYGDRGTLILENNYINQNKVVSHLKNGFGGGVSVIADNDVSIRIAFNVFEKDTVIGQEYAAGGGVYYDSYGILSSGGRVYGNIFRNNYTEALNNGSVGGGLYYGQANAGIIKENLFIDNIVKSKYAHSQAGGLIVDNRWLYTLKSKEIYGNSFINNTAIFEDGTFASGGGLEIYYTIAHVSQNYFNGNSLTGNSATGGAVRFARSAFLLENNIFTENFAYTGGAIRIAGTPAHGTGQNIINNTITKNSSSTSASGIEVSGSSVNIINSILWSNSNDQIAAINGGSVNVNYCCIQEGWIGVGNLKSDPQFVEHDSFYNISDSSPCISAGIDSILIAGHWYYSPADDFDSDPRPNCTGSIPDIGAQESPFPLTSIFDKEFDLPQMFLLKQNYPNPFNPSTTIEFQIPNSQFTTLKVYDILGREVSTLVSQKLNVGNHICTFNGSNLASGIYYYQLIAGDYSEVRKMMLLR